MKNWNAVLGLLAALLLGACAGFYGYNAYLRHRIRNFSSGDMQAKFAEWMTRELSLDEAQSAAVRGVMEEFGGRFEAQRQANHAAMDAIREEMVAELEKHFTPEQAELHRRLMEEGRAKFEKRRELRRAMGAPPP